MPHSPAPSPRARARGAHDEVTTRHDERRTRGAATCAARGRQGPWGERARQREGKSQSRGTAVVQVDDCCVRASSFFGRKRFCGRQVPHAKIIKNVESRPHVRLCPPLHAGGDSPRHTRSLDVDNKACIGGNELRSSRVIETKRGNAGCSETQPYRGGRHKET